VVEELEAKKKCPGFYGVLPGMRLVEPQKSKSGDNSTVLKKLKSFFMG
jgi:hypothetical protein